MAERENSSRPDYELQNLLLRKVGILSVWQHEGLPMNSKRGGLFFYPFGSDSGKAEKDPSFHINAKENVFYCFGESHKEEICRVLGRSRPGGNVVDFAKLVLTLRHGVPVGDLRDPSEMRKVVEYLGSVEPGLSLYDTLGPVRGGKAQGSAPARVAANGPLAGRVCNSGGAKGADKLFGDEGAVYGMKVNHFYHPEKKSPFGNTPITQQDIDEGKREAAAAAARMYGYSYSSMKDGNLIRDWAQVKYSEMVVAVARLRPAGARFSDTPGDDRILSTASVVGGTGYAVNMAILHRKPVHVFNMEENGAFHEGWYRYDAAAGAYVPGEVPLITAAFAGVGSRELTDAGRKAVSDVYAKAVAQALSRKEVAAEDRRRKEVPEVDRSRVLTVGGPGAESSPLSMEAFAPFVLKGKFFFSAEQYVQWRKATLAGDAASAGRIYALGDGFARRRMGEEPSGEDLSGAVRLSREAAGIGALVRGSAAVAEAWRGGVRDEAVKTALWAKFMSNPDAAEALLATGKCLLSSPEGGAVKDYPLMLMELRSELRGMGLESGSLESEKQVEVFSAFQGVRDRSLLGYLVGERGQTPRQCADLFQEVTYGFSTEDDPQAIRSPRRKGIATPTVSGTYDIRTLPWTDRDGKYQKGLKLSSGQDYSLLSGGRFIVGQDPAPGSAMVLVFEGKMDPGSYMNLLNRETPWCDIVILNSTSNVDRALPQVLKYGTVFLCLDNDESGQKATLSMAAACLANGKAVFDCRPVFMGQESRAMLMYTGVPCVRTVGSDGRWIPEAEWSQERDGAAAERAVVPCLTSKGRVVTAQSWWGSRLGTGANDANEGWLQELGRRRANAQVPVPKAVPEQAETVQVRPK